MANSYSSGIFDIDTSTDLAGLIALKGSAPSGTDYLYIAEGATVTLDDNCSFLLIYLGDNSAGTATTKTGHCILSASGSSKTLTLYDTTQGGGLRGEGSTSTYTFTGASESVRAIVKSNTSQKVGTANAEAVKIIANYATFESIYAIDANAAHDIQNTIFTGTCMYALRVTNVKYVKPTKFDNIVCDRSTAVIYDSSTSNFIDWRDFFTYNRVKVVGGGSGTTRSNFQAGYDTATRWLYYRAESASIIDAPTWDTNTGIQSLITNDNGTLTASWNSATHGTGDTVRYRIYIRADEAPDEFGVVSPYYLGETTGTSFTIAQDAGGNALVAGTTYYVIVRAATALSFEDANTETKNATVLNKKDRLKLIMMPNGNIIPSILIGKLVVPL